MPVDAKKNARGEIVGHQVTGRRPNSYKEEKLVKFSANVPLLIAIAGLKSVDMSKMSDAEIDAEMEKRLQLLLRANRKLDLFKREI